MTLLRGEGGEVARAAAVHGPQDLPPRHRHWDLRTRAVPSQRGSVCRHGGGCRQGLTPVPFQWAMSKQSDTGPEDEEEEVDEEA